MVVVCVETRKGICCSVVQLMAVTVLFLRHVAGRKIGAHAQHVEDICRVHIVLYWIWLMHQRCMGMAIKVIRDVRMAMRRSRRVRMEKRRGIGRRMMRWIQSNRSNMVIYRLWLWLRLRLLLLYLLLVQLAISNTRGE